VPASIEVAERELDHTVRCGAVDGIVADVGIEVGEW
jgi:hypothetical protein